MAVTCHMKYPAYGRYINSTNFLIESLFVLHLSTQKRVKISRVEHIESLSIQRKA